MNTGMVGMKFPPILWRKKSLKLSGQSYGACEVAAKTVAGKQSQTQRTVV